MSIMKQLEDRIVARIMGVLMGVETPSAAQSELIESHETPIVTMPTSTNGPLDLVGLVADEPTIIPTVEPTKGKRRSSRRGYKPRVAYKLTASGAKVAADKGKMGKLKDVLFPTTFAVFKAVHGAGKDGIHAKVVEAETNLGRKTVESDLYKLRTTKPALVESFPVSK